MFVLADRSRTSGLTQHRLSKASFSVVEDHGQKQAEQRGPRLSACLLDRDNVGVASPPAVSNGDDDLGVKEHRLMNWPDPLRIDEDMLQLGDRAKRGGGDRQLN
jgi:hypothetical protein